MDSGDGLTLVESPSRERREERLRSGDPLARLLATIPPPVDVPRPDVRGLSGKQRQRAKQRWARQVATQTEQRNAVIRRVMAQLNHDRPA